MQQFYWNHTYTTIRDTLPPFLWKSRIRIPLGFWAEPRPRWSQAHALPSRSAGCQVIEDQKHEPNVAMWARNSQTLTHIYIYLCLYYNYIRIILYIIYIHTYIWDSQDIGNHLVFGRRAHPFEEVLRGQIHGFLRPDCLKFTERIRPGWGTRHGTTPTAGMWCLCGDWATAYFGEAPWLADLGLTPVIYGYCSIGKMVINQWMVAG